MIDLRRAFETEGGIISDGVILPESIFEATRSYKPTYTGDLLTTEEFYNSLSQVDVNRIARMDHTFTDHLVTSTTVTYYEPDGVTVFRTESYAYTYNLDDSIIDIEVT